MLKQERNQLAEDLAKCNEDIMSQSWKFDQEQRKFSDKGLLQRHIRETMGLKQENSLCNIDINIADSRKTDLEAQQDMCNVQLQEILTEKRKIEKENQELEYKIQGRGVTEADAKAKVFEAERHMERTLQHALQVMREDAEVMHEELKVEEAKCKTMLDLKIDAENMFKNVTEPDAQEMDAKKKQNREDLLSKRIKLSQLKSQRERMTDESKVLTKSNEILLKDNGDYDIKNKKLNAEILEIVQRIDVTNLLKEVDLEEMKLLATNNLKMNQMFQSVLNSWDNIQRDGKD